MHDSRPSAAPSDPGDGLNSRVEPRPSTVEMYRLAWGDLEGVFGFLKDQRDFVFLDTSRPDRENHTSLLFTEPVARLRARGSREQDERCEPGDEFHAAAGNFRLNSRPGLAPRILRFIRP